MARPAVTRRDIGENWHFSLTALGMKRNEEAAIQVVVPIYYDVIQDRRLATG